MADDKLLQKWLQKGNDDLRSAEYLSTMHHPTPDEIICYLCQQSAEKYLKGFLLLNGVEPPKIHDLKILLDMCIKYNESFSVLLPKIYILRVYAILPRYPNEIGITAEDMKTAIRYAKDVQEFIMGAITPPAE